MKKTKINRHQYFRQAGQSLVEYGLILSLIAVVSIAGLQLLGGSINTQLTNLANIMSNASDGPALAVTAPPASSPNGGSSPSTVETSSNDNSTVTPASGIDNTPDAPASVAEQQPLTQNQTVPTEQQQAQPVSDAQQGATLDCNGGAGSDPRCAGNVDVGSQWGW